MFRHYALTPCYCASCWLGPLLADLRRCDGSKVPPTEQPGLLLENSSFFLHITNACALSPDALLQGCAVADDSPPEFARFEDEPPEHPAPPLLHHYHAWLATPFRCS